jgi:hypothetical protein
MARQLRFRFPASELVTDAPLWAICACPGSTPFALVQFDAETRLNRRAGIYYTRTIDAARAALPPGLLCIPVADGKTQLVGRLPAPLTAVLEVWF